MSVVIDRMSPVTDIDPQATMWAHQVEEYVVSYLNQRQLPANLVNAVQYSFLAPGKRLRPILVLQACHAVGGQFESGMVSAAAIEMVHCFSMIHDDLPAMDDDDLRRGRPTLHRHTNEAMAILAGDVLMGMAFEMVSKRVKPLALAARIIRELSTATNDMIAGQVYDTLPDFASDLDGLTKLKTIHVNKTAALLRASVRMGGLCGEASEDELKCLTGYGEAIGLMYQVVDDLLDVTASEKQMGKATHKDAGQGKLTYPGLMGIASSRQQVITLQTMAHRALADLGKPAQRLKNLCDYMAVRTQ